MHIDIDIEKFRVTGKKPFILSEAPNEVEPLHKDKDEYEDLLKEFQEEINDLQNMMYADNRYGLLLIFQAMDAAGKDGTIQHVMSGVNPHGVKVHAFKKPSENELEHDFMWRTSLRLPDRGTIGIFNRSYYEEVLVVKVHPEILTKYQRIPAELNSDLNEAFKRRYEDIRNFEQYLFNNGFRVMKFFLNISKEEQRKRFIDRIDEKSKNWKFSDADVKERAYWDQYMQAYEACINSTASPEAPWYVIPGNDKKNMRLIVSQLILDEMKQFNMEYPQVTDARRDELKAIRELLENEGK